MKIRERGAASLALLVLALLVGPLPAWAHPGAPYLIAVEEQAGPYKLTAWADPDTGEGTFLLDLYGAQGVKPVIRVWPVDGHRGAAEYQAWPENQPEGLRYVAKVPFDAVGPWDVTLRVEGPLGPGKLDRRVDVTPPGLEWWQTALLLLPFLALGGFWLAGLRKQGEATESVP